MGEYKTTDYVILKVRSLLGSIGKPKYPINRPTVELLPPEYIVINSLPIVGDVMQKCYVNVNYHVKDIASGVPDLDKLESGSQSVLAILKKYTGSDFLIDFEEQHTYTESDQNEHYSNLRFSFKQINK